MSFASDTLPLRKVSPFHRVLHYFFLMSRGLTLGVRAVVRSPDGKFLLVRHTYTPGWHFPGGGVDRGETAEDAVVKELRQETGLALTGRPLLFGAYFNGDVSNRDHVLVYLCEAEFQLLSSPRSLEIAEIGYFAFENLPEGTDRGTVDRMREIFGARERSATW
jgi:ADP-ribose pyrophosphatase YjhB (NUDIX family)